MTLRDVLVNAGRKKVKIKSSFFIAKLYRNHIFMVSSTTSFHSSHSPVFVLFFAWFFLLIVCLNVLNFPICPPSSFLPSFIPCFLPSFLNSFLSGPLLSSKTDQWNVDRTKDVGLPDSLLGLMVFSPHVLHTFDCAHTHSLSLWSVFKIFVHMLLVFLWTFVAVVSIVHFCSDVDWTKNNCCSFWSLLPKALFFFSFKLKDEESTETNKQTRAKCPCLCETTIRLFVFSSHPQGILY